MNMKQIEQTETNDVLARVLEDEACDNLMYDSLMRELKSDPITFYKDFVLPRSSKLTNIIQLTSVTQLTPAQEVAEMDRRTSPDDVQTLNKTAGL